MPVPPVLARAPRAVRLLGLGAAGFLLAACQGEDPPVATELVAAGTTQFSARVNESAGNPAVTLTDQRGSPMSGQLVRWRVVTGGGQVTNDTVRTDGTGRALSGGWVLGTGTGEQTLSATVDGLAPVTFRATAAAGPPARYDVAVAPTQSATVGQPVPNPLFTIVTDAFGNPVPNLPVEFRVSSGGGQILGNATPLTNAQGRAQIDGWVLGTARGVQRARATAQGLAASVFFEANAVADAPVRMNAASPETQDGVDGLAVLDRPAVEVFDQYDNPVGGVTVTFEAVGTSGTVVGGTQVTDSIFGRAEVGDWVLGNAPAQQLRARTAALPNAEVTFSAGVVQSLFDVDVRLIGAEPTPRMAAAIAHTVERWKRVIVGSLPAVPVSAGAGSCFEPSIPPIDEAIENVVIFMELDSIDGPGSVLGYARSCAIRTSIQPLYGYMRLDTADLANMSDAVLDGVLTHEVGHVLGISRVYWQAANLLVGFGGTSPYYQGVNGRQQFELLPGLDFTGTPVPVEYDPGFGAGTNYSHWSTPILSEGAKRELMVGFASSDMRLSRLTVGALADLGFEVRYGGADQLAFGAAALRFGRETHDDAGAALGDDDRTEDVYMYDAAGNRRLVWTRSGPRIDALPPGAGGGSPGRRPTSGR